MGAPKTLALFFVFLLLLSACSQGQSRTRPPCKNMTLYLHDILYNGHNAANATSAIVAAPSGSNLIKLAGQLHFGNLVALEDPLTTDAHLMSTPVGWAQGMYLYDSKKSFAAAFGMTLVLPGRGTLQVMGADPILMAQRDMSVVGGTGEFFMARGIVTLMTDAFEGEVYFRLRMDIKLYECWPSAPGSIH